jgi:hypothetical protein
MKNFLSKALELSNTVIIPGFGALTITSTRTMDIYFIPYLKHDDGNLNKVICEETGKEKAEVKTLIQEFVEEVKSELESTNYYEIAEFGRFKKLHTGDVEFEKWSEYHKEDTSVLAASKRKKESEKKPTLEVAKETAPITPEIQETEEEKELVSVDKTAIEIESYTPETPSTDLDSILAENDESTKEIQLEIVVEKHENTKIEITEQIENNDNNYVNQEVEEETINSSITPITEELPIIEINPVIEELPTESVENENTQLNIIEKSSNEEINSPEKSTKEKNSKKKEKKEKPVKVKKEKKKPTDNKEGDPKKKKSGIILWLLLGVGITSAVMAYILHSRKNEKIIISEKTIESKDSKKTEITTKVIRDKEIEHDSKVSSVSKPAAKTKVEPKKPTTESKKPEVKKETKKIVVAEKPKVTPTEKPKVKPASKKVDATTPTASPVVSNSKPANKRPSKKELAEADNIVNQLNSSKKNSEAITTIKMNAQNKAITQNQNASTKPVAPVTNQPAKAPVTTQNATNKPTTSVPAGTQKTTPNQPAKTQVQSPAPTKTAEPATPSKPVSGGGVAGKKIELIAESFKDKASADKLVTKLKQDGYSNARVESKDGQYNVVIDSYNTLSETMKELKKYRGQ